ncbi:MAG: hypothetical protein AAGJ81_10445 [Verrucomicrobiota bacterium]
MSLLEVLFFLINAIIAVQVSVWAYNEHGVIAAIFGAIVGFLLLPLILFLSMLSLAGYAKTTRRFFGWHKDSKYPRCSCGSELVLDKSYPTKDHPHMMLKCESCGLRFRDNVNKIYLEGDDGSVELYATRSMLTGKWKNVIETTLDCSDRSEITN